MGRRPGKLKAAARWLVLPADAAAEPGQTAEDEAALREAGVSEADIAAGREVLREAPGDRAEAPSVWAWHVDAARLFGAMRKQWRVVANQTGLLYLGLDFAAMAEPRRMLRIRPSPELMEQLRVMESAGAEALNELCAT